jgi:hypothetical protein
MKFLIILTILISSSAHSITNSKEYAEYVMEVANENNKFSKLECVNPVGELYTCELIKTGGTDEQYGHEYVYLVGKVRELNKAINTDKIRKLTITTKGYRSAGQKEVAVHR